LTVGAFDGSGKDDIAVATGDGDSVIVYLNSGQGRFRVAPGVAFKTGGRYAEVVRSGRFTGSGHVDLVVASQYDSSISILRGNGDGTFALVSTSPLAAPELNGGPPALAVGRFTAAPTDDLAMDVQFKGDVSVWHGNGDGTFERAGKRVASIIQRHLRMPDGWQTPPRLPPNVSEMAVQPHGDGTNEALVLSSIPTSLGRVDEVAKSAESTAEKAHATILASGYRKACTDRDFFLTYRSVVGARTFEYHVFTTILDGRNYATVYVHVVGTPELAAPDAALTSFCAP
jgi:hypothetical protein